MALIEDAEPLLSEMRAAIDAVHECKYRVDAARAAILSGLSSDQPDTREILVALEQFDRARQVAESKPIMPEINPHYADWMRFEARLADDSTASIDDNSPIAAMPRASMPVAVVDPVLAAAQAAASFPSQSVQR